MKPTYTDILVDVTDAHALDATLSMLPGVLARVVGVGMSGGPERVDWHYVVRVLAGDPKFAEFAMQRQGYATVVGRRAKDHG